MSLLSRGESLCLWLGGLGGLFYGSGSFLGALFGRLGTLSATTTAAGRLFLFNGGGRFFDYLTGCGTRCAFDDFDFVAALIGHSTGGVANFHRLIGYLCGCRIDR